jgi:hypothetical protein
MPPASGTTATDNDPDNDLSGGKGYGDPNANSNSGTTGVGGGGTGISTGVGGTGSGPGVTGNGPGVPGNAPGSTGDAPAGSLNQEPNTYTNGNGSLNVPMSQNANQTTADAAAKKDGISTAEVRAAGFKEGIVDCGREGTAKERALGCDFKAFIEFLQRLINYVIILVVISTSIFIAWDGYQYMESRDKPGNLSALKSRLGYMAIGIAMMLGAWLVFTTLADFLLQGSGNYKDYIYLIRK